MVECSPATRAARVRFPDDANLFFFTYTQPPSAHHLPECKVHLLGVLGLKIKKKSFGDAGYRSPYLSHAKRALYHLSYVPKLQYCSYKFSVYQPSSGWNYVSRPPPANQSDPIITPQPLYPTFDSSVGRAVDCSCSMSDIHRSLVQIRLEGVFAVFIKKRK